MSSCSRYILLSLSTVFLAGAGFIWWRRNRKKYFRPVGHVSGLFIYPVKSCKGIPLDSCLCLAQGLQHDRRWVIIDRKGALLDIMRKPSLAMVSPHFDEDMKHLYLDAPGMETLEVSLPIDTKEFRDILVQRMHGEGEWAGEVAGAWLSKYLDMAGCQLYHLSKPRFLITDWKWHDLVEKDDKTGFAYVSPVLVCTHEALVALNRHMESTVSMNRFRPNIVITGTATHEEENWRRLKVGDGVEIRCIKNCSRCIVINADPETGEMGKEPLRTLNRTRYKVNKDKRYAAAFFGINCAVDRIGHVRVGDPVLASCYKK